MSLVVALPASTLATPRSSAANHEPPLPVTTERDAVRAFERASQAQSGADSDGSCFSEYADGSYFTEYALDDFEIYNDVKGARNRLRSPHLLGQTGYGVMYFDGILRDGGLAFCVQRVAFSRLSLGNYGAEHDSVGRELLIQSQWHESAQRPVYYRLGRPAAVYARFFSPFCWLADLAKHFVDYCDEAKGDVRLSHFRQAFAQWLRRRHSASPVVAAWWAQYSCRLGDGGSSRPDARNDFRGPIVAHAAFLCRECCGVLGEAAADRLGVMRELRLQFYRLHRAPLPAGHPRDDRGDALVPLPTVVTPYVYRCFRRMAIGVLLKRTARAGAVGAAYASHIMPQHRPVLRTRRPAGAIRIGDVISTAPDAAGPWDQGAEKSGRWYALVHGISQSRSAEGARVFDVGWLYRPEHTPCRQMRYPWAKELFLSDHCTCGEGAGHRIAQDEVLGVHSVDWFGQPQTQADFFVRQTYLHGERRWVQLRPAHLFCQRAWRQLERPDATAFGEHLAQTAAAAMAKTAEPVYRVGDTVLAVLADAGGDEDGRSEPCEVTALFTEQADDMVRLRRLLRRREVDAEAATAAPNELVYTQQFVSVRLSRVVGRCVVRAFSPGAPIPTPYDRDGAGNVFFMTQAWAEMPDQSGTCFPPLGHTTLRQGFDPQAPTPQLRALDLFCGCGSLGRGLEDARAVRTCWQNDIWAPAIHTCMANQGRSDGPDDAEAGPEPFFGSADVLLERALQGQFCRAVPAPGEVDLISGGSPCQGFSRLTKNRETPQQYKNRSMVASFASFVDLYRPKYGVLENVLAMVGGQDRGGGGGGGGGGGRGSREDIFGQLVCTLLGLGYQLAIMLGNAWAYGAPQHRERVFLVFAAPGLTLPQVPLPSHATPPSYRAKAVGRLSNDEYMAAAYHGPTAFPFVSARAATADLDGADARIDDGQSDICIRFPDHRLSVRVSDQMRLRIAHIPTQPYGMGFARAWDHGRRHRPGTDAGTGSMTPQVRALFPCDPELENSPRAWSRLHPEQQFKTVTTSCNVADKRTGNCLHWEDPRPLSILEVRRAQGLPDHEVLLGSAKDQWKLVGNAVARPLALALGLAIREAWLGTLAEGTSSSVGPAGKRESGAVVIELECKRRRSNSSTGIPRAQGILID